MVVGLVLRLGHFGFQETGCTLTYSNNGITLITVLKFDT